MAQREHQVAAELGDVGADRIVAQRPDLPPDRLEQRLDLGHGFRITRDEDVELLRRRRRRAPRNRRGDIADPGGGVGGFQLLDQRQRDCREHDVDEPGSRRRQRP